MPLVGPTTSAGVPEAAGFSADHVAADPLVRGRYLQCAIDPEPSLAAFFVPAKHAAHCRFDLEYPSDPFNSPDWQTLFAAYFELEQDLQPTYRQVQNRAFDAKTF